MNRMSLASIGGQTLAEMVHGETPDISMIPRFHFWEPVHYACNDNTGGKNFPYQTDEEKG